MVAATIGLFMAALAVNMLLFPQLEFAPGINWIYLPAGVRLLSTLLFAEEGAIGLLLVSLVTGFYIFFPGDPSRAVIGAVVTSAAPYGTYLAARRWGGLGAGLQALTSTRLLTLALAYAVASPLLLHIWFAIHGDPGLLRGFFVMAAGDLSGSLLVLYSAKLALIFASAGRR
jgi:hypothetical protein